MGLNRKVLANKLEKRGFSTDISTAIDDVNDLINEKIKDGKQQVR